MFNSLEELKAAVEERRQAILTLEVDLGGAFSQEHEDAKQELAQAQGMKAMLGGANFLGGDNIEALKQRVEDTRPPAKSVWLQYKKLSLDEWAQLTKSTIGTSAIDQYEKVLPKTFIGVFGQDPTDDDGHPIEGVEPLSTDARLASTRGPDGILPGGSLNSVVQRFMAWQNSGGDVTIRPTRSGQD